MSGSRERTRDFPIVALVCSAGGLTALIDVLERLPTGFPAALIALQHHSADTSYLTAILGEHCPLPVQSATDGQPLEPASVAVVPPGHHALVTAGDDLVLIDAGKPPPYRPSADLLLTSLAIAAASRTIAVILSGTGHDGAAGAAAVHRLGGFVIASDEASSLFFDMPHAAIRKQGVVDATVPLEGIGPLLVATVSARRPDGPGGDA